ncbi:MAG: PorV/PorQ family protein, partial [Saprospiraceae bacterium]|nr:PorV/PorQ family protein [Saprospiraceae bacterium]
MNRLTLLCVLALMFGMTSEISAQCSYNPASGKWEDLGGGPCVNTLITSVPFLRIVPDARSAAMGDAGIGISADPNAMHFNASKLAFAEEDVSLSATYSPWLRSLGLQDVYLAYLSGYKKLDENQALGLSLRYFSLGDIAFTDDNGESLGTGRPNEFEVSLAYARKLAEKFS